jgi:DNA-binding protein Fis
MKYILSAVSLVMAVITIGVLYCFETTEVKQVKASTEIVEPSQANLYYDEFLNSNGFDTNLFYDNGLHSVETPFLMTPGNYCEDK